MAFGLPNTDGATSGNGEFLGRITYDARVGFWKTTKRVKGADGYASEEGTPTQQVAFAADFGSLEVGYSKIASPPVFMVVPMGQPLPPQPEEMSAPDPKTGRVTKAFKPCFRVRVASSKTFGDGDAYYFSSNAKNVLNAMDALHNVYLSSPEAAEGKIPVVQSIKSTAIKTTNPSGTSTFYAPEFSILSWIDRPAVFGDRTVPAPGASAPRPIPAAPVTRHVPPPAPVAQPVREMAMADDSDLPF